MGQSFVGVDDIVDDVGVAGVYVLDITVELGLKELELG